MPPCGSFKGSRQSSASLNQRQVIKLFWWSENDNHITKSPEKIVEPDRHAWCKTFHCILVFYDVAYCRVKQLGAGGVRAAEEAMLWYQVLIRIHRALHVLPADQGAVQFCV